MQIDLSRLHPVLVECGVERVLVVTGRSRRFLGLVEPALKDLECTVFDGARTHVPVSTIDAAETVLREAQAQAMVALGGGAAIGLSKILKLRHPLRFAAVPTTYAGSEMTNIWGMTEGDRKTTGRDERVRPDWVVYDGRFSMTMPVALTIQSLMNAMAHPLSALSTGMLAAELVEPAHEAVRAILSVAEPLLDNPEDVGLRKRAHEAAAAAAKILDQSAMGQHHKAAHFLGGRFQLPHAALHSVLLPCSVEIMKRAHPELLSSLGEPDLSGRIRQLLGRAGAPRSLGELGVDLDQLEGAVDQSDAFFPIVRAALSASR